MKKILLAVDDTKSSIKIIDKMSEIFCTCMPKGDCFALRAKNHFRRISYG